MNMVLLNLVLLVFYVYFGYFALVLLLGRLLQRKVQKASIEPHVTMLISAYNEEKSIARKIQDSLKLDYPEDKLRIIVVSDGSTDRTDDIVKSFRKVELFRVEGRVGKTEARNEVLKAIKGEIILFSDATTEYRPDVIRKIVRNFADPTVGMVTGHLVYHSPGSSQMGPGQVLYWKYESMIKKAQTAMGTLTGSVGCLTAFRKELYCPLPANVIEDFTEPLMLVMKGKRVVYEEEAVCFEETTKKSSNEWSMRVRVIRGGMRGLLYAREIFNPLKYPLPFLQLLSHKVLRWLVPVFMIMIFLLNALIVFEGSANWFSGPLFVAQLGFYSLAVLALVLESFGVRLRLASVPSYFLVLNAASLVALIKTFTSDLEATWETQREV